MRALKSDTVKHVTGVELRYLVLCCIVVGCIAVFLFNAIHTSIIEKVLHKEVNTVVDLFESQHIAHASDALFELGASTAMHDVFFDASKFENEEFVSKILIAIRASLKASIVYVMNPRGVVVASTYEAFLGNDYSFRPYFSKAIQGEGVLYGALGVTTHVPGLYVSAPIHSFVDRSAEGVIVAKFNVSGLEDYLKRQQCSVAIIAPEGVVFATNVLPFKYRYIQSLSKQEVYKIEDSRQFGVEALRPLPFSVTKKIFRYQGSRYVAITHKDNLKGWQIVGWRMASFFLGAAVCFFISIALFIGSLILFCFWRRRMNLERIMNQQHQILHNVLENIPYYVFWKDEHLVYRWCSESFAHFVGLESAADIKGKTDFDLMLGQEAAESYRAADAHVIETGEAILNFEESVLNVKGDSLDVLISKVPLRNKHGNVYGVLGIFVDITEQNKTRVRIERSKNELEAVLASVLSGVVIIRARDFVIVEVNDAAETIMGVARSQLVGKVCYDVMCSSDEASCPVKNEEKETVLLECMLCATSGACIPVLKKVTRVMFEEEYFIESFTDITSYKKLEAELRASRDSLQVLIDTMPEPVFMKDKDDMFILCNKVFADALEKDRLEIVGKTLYDLLPADIADRYSKMDRALLSSEASDQREETFLFKGRIYSVAVSRACYFDQNGKAAGVVGVIMDMQDQKDAEAQRDLLELELQQAQKLESIGALAAGVAHEINTPVQFISNNINFISRGIAQIYTLLEGYNKRIFDVLPDAGAIARELEKNVQLDFLKVEVKRAVAQSEEGIERVSAIVSAMTEFSHMGGEQMTDADINAAVESVVAIARAEWKKVCELKTELCLSLPAVQCHIGDIKQVILNVLLNAIHAIEEKVELHELIEGRITIATYVEDECVVFSIEDNGVGIPEDVQGRVLDHFFTTKEVGKGTGQGLALAYRLIVEKHGGKLTFQTEEGIGTTFFVRLPIQQLTFE